MPRLPQPGSDQGSWGTILNDFLAISHTSSGALKDDVVGTTTIVDGTVTETKLASAVQTKLNTAPSKADVGLGNVDNTSDANKPVSSATQTALNTKAALSHTHPISDVVNLSSTFIARVVYSAGWPARPAVTYVEWVGPVDPGVLAQNGDTWVDTSS